MSFDTIILTGGIGSGKSTVLNIIKAETETKVEFFSFDEFTRELYENNEVKDILQIMFGTSERTKISKMVFSSGKPELLSQLNDFFFGLVEDKFISLIDRKAHSHLVIEMPMYFEMKAKSTQMQLLRAKTKVIVVTCNETIRCNRVQKRDGFDLDRIKAIMASQADEQKKVESADYVIDTSDGDSKNKTISLMKQKFKKVFYRADVK